MSRENKYRKVTFYVAGVLILLLTALVCGSLYTPMHPVLDGVAPAPAATVERIKSPVHTAAPSPTNSAGPTVHGRRVDADVDRSTNHTQATRPHLRNKTNDEVLASYRRAVHCQSYAYALKALAAISKAAIPSVNSEQDAADVRKQLNNVDKTVQRYQDECNGVGLEEIDKHLFESSLQAGLRGNLGAQSCFIHGDFFGAAGYRKSGNRRQQYLTYAPRFMEHGLDVGYWPTVLAALQILMDNMGGLPQSLGDLPRPDPYRVYRAVRLTYYRSDNAGINPPYGMSLSDIMRVLAQRYHLSPSDIAQADAWAQQVYQARYADTPPLNPWRTTGCP